MYFKTCSACSLWDHSDLSFYVDVITEIFRASGLGPSQSFLDHERMEQGSPLSSVGLHSNGGPMDLEGWAGMQTEVVLFLYY